MSLFFHHLDAEVDFNSFVSDGPEESKGGNTKQGKAFTQASAGVPGGAAGRAGAVADPTEPPRRPNAARHNFTRRIRTRKPTRTSGNYPVINYYGVYLLVYVK